MTPHTLVIQAPAPAAQLFLLFHDAHQSPDAMSGVAARLAQEFAQAMIVAVAAPEPSENGQGLQWFSTLGLSDDNRGERIASAMPVMQACVRHWQRASAVAPSATAVIGFAQGATMALELSQQLPVMAARVVAIAGQFAALPQNSTNDITTHMLHGKLDRVVPYSHTVNAAHHLRDLGADITAEILPFIGHEIHPDFIDQVILQLTTHVPKRIWESALKADPAGQ